MSALSDAASAVKQQATMGTATRTESSSSTRTGHMAGWRVNISGQAQHSTKVQQPCRPAWTSSDQRWLATCTNDWHW